MLLLLILAAPAGEPPSCKCCCCSLTGSCSAIALQIWLEKLVCAAHAAAAAAVADVVALVKLAIAPGRPTPSTAGCTSLSNCLADASTCSWGCSVSGCAGGLPGCVMLLVLQIVASLLRL
jgi:hypothetical protein